MGNMHHCIRVWQVQANSPFCMLVSFSVRCAFIFLTYWIFQLVSCLDLTPSVLRCPILPSGCIPGIQEGRGEDYWLVWAARFSRKIITVPDESKMSGLQSEMEAQTRFLGANPEWNSIKERLDLTLYLCGSRWHMSDQIKYPFCAGVLAHDTPSQAVSGLYTDINQWWCWAMHGLRSFDSTWIYHPLIM